MDISSAIYSAFTGVTTGVIANMIYDKFHAISPQVCHTLKNKAQHETQQDFNNYLQGILDLNSKLLDELKNITSSSHNTYIHQEHSGSGDSVAGNKTTNHYNIPSFRN